MRRSSELPLMLSRAFAHLADGVSLEVRMGQEQRTPTLGQTSLNIGGLLPRSRRARWYLTEKLNCCRDSFSNRRCRRQYGPA